MNKARCKLEQKPKPEKKIPAKEPKSSPDKPKRDAEAEKVSVKYGTWLQSVPHRFLLMIWIFPFD